MDFRRDCLGIGMPDIPGCPATSGGYIAQYAAVYYQFTDPPPANVADAQNTMVTTLVNAGIWTTFDVFYLFANYDSTDALLNWINPGTYTATAVGAPGFISYDGYLGDGAGKYINTGWDPGTNGVNLTQNSTFLAYGSGTDGQDAGYEIGCYDGTHYLAIRCRHTNNITYAYVNSPSGTQANTNGKRHLAVSRTGVAGFDLYLNTTRSAEVVVSTGVPTGRAMFVCAYNVNGVPVESARFIRYAIAGGGLSEANVNIVINAMETYLDSVGTGLIP